MRIGILTGGGDVPGLNACIKAVVTRATEAGHDVIGIRRGWGGLVETFPDDPGSVERNLLPLTPDTVRTIDRYGGTTLHTSRTNPGKVKPDEVPAALGRGSTAGTPAAPGGADDASSPAGGAGGSSLRPDTVAPGGADDASSPAGGAGGSSPRPDTVAPGGADDVSSRAGGAGGSSPRTGTVDLTPHVLEVLEHQKIDVLIPIGGDDTLSYALRMHDEGVRVVAIPKTMDNDVHGTDYCIGFSTAITRSVEFVHALRTSTGSHERIAVVELFGRYSGETSLITAYLAGVDRCVISEVPVAVDRLAALLGEDKRRNPSNYAMVTVSEGARIIGGDMVQGGPADAYGHQKLGGVGLLLSELLKERTGEDIVYQQVGYLMRSGPPDSLDLMVGTNYAVMAADLAAEGSSGRMVALRSGTYTNVPIAVTREGVKRVDVDELYDSDGYRPKIRHVGGKPMFLY